jgi:large subunit ribosomal protein L23
MKKEDCYNLFAAMHLSEKVTSLNGMSKYCFRVVNSANKQQVKEAVEVVFGVKPLSVNVINRKSKARNFKGVRGRVKAYKKAIVTLEKGKTIDLGA